MQGTKGRFLEREGLSLSSRPPESRIYWFKRGGRGGWKGSKRSLNIGGGFESEKGEGKCIL